MTTDTQQSIAGAASHDPALRVAICVCTYQRTEGLQALLAGLCAQRFTDLAPPVVTVIVADNECSDRNRAICAHYTRRCQYSLVYTHAPQRGISHARNTSLEQLPADTDFVAMIDDDEIPEPDWLNHLLLAQQKTGADVVAGPTLPTFPQGVAPWIVETGYFDTPHDPGHYTDLQEYPPVATGNVLIRASVFTRGGKRFDPLLAHSGSEDKLLFQDLKQQGLKFVWAARATAYESVPAARATFRYMLSEAFRQGSTRFYVKSKLKANTPARRSKLVLRSLLRAIFGVCRHSIGALLQLPKGLRHNPDLALNIVGIVENIGFAAGVFGYRKKHY